MGSLRTASYSWSALLAYKLICMWGLSSPLTIYQRHLIRCIGGKSKISEKTVLAGFQNNTHKLGNLVYISPPLPRFSSDLYKICYANRGHMYNYN